VKHHASPVAVFSAICLLMPSLLPAQVDTTWVRRYTGPGSQSDVAYAIAVDRQGNVCVTGVKAVSGTNYDFATIKYSPAGETLWLRTYDGPANSYDYGRAIAVDTAGNVYVTGGSNGVSSNYDFATIKYRPNGDVAWTARYNAPANRGDDPSAIAVDQSGNVFVTGESESTGTAVDYTTVKYDSGGGLAWARRYNGLGNSYDYALALALDGAGNACVTGRSTGVGTGDDIATVKYSPGGESLWVRRYDGPGSSTDGATAITVDGAGNFYVTGNQYIDAVSGTDYVTIKYAPAGGMQWVATYNGPGSGFDGATAVAVDDSGRVYVTGYSVISGSNYDYATVQYSPSGDSLWTARYSGSEIQSDFARALALDRSGGVYVTGESYVGNYDYATVKYDAAGTEQWVVRYNGTGNGDDYATALAVDDSAGRVYVTGRSTGNGYDYATIAYTQTTGVEERFGAAPAGRSRLVLKPNPARGVLHVRWAPAAAPVPAIMVLDGCGRRVTGRATPVVSTGCGKAVVPLGGLTPGVYFLRLGSETGKFLVAE